MSKKSKPNQVLDVFFKPRAPLNPSTVSAPPPIRPSETSIVDLTVTPTLDHSDQDSDTLAHAKPACQVTELLKESKAEASQGRTTMSQSLARLGAHNTPAENNQVWSIKGCERGVSLLRDLEAAVNRIPSDTPSTTPEHRLSIFAVDPRTCIAEPGEDDWFILNQMMKSAFGWGETEMAMVVPQLLNHGEHGLDGFIRFMTFFVSERGLQGALFETKVEALLKELKDW